MKAINLLTFQQRHFTTSKRAKAFDEIIKKVKSVKEKKDRAPLFPGEEATPEVANNDYVKLIKRLKALRDEPDRELTQEEVREILRDIEIEESDEEFVQREKGTIDVKFMRPPKTTGEILTTLKEADQRYERNVEFLAGSKQGAKLVRSEEAKDKRKAESKRSLLDNVPPGVTISRLEYPVYVEGKLKMSTVILLGVKQRAIIHASFVNDFLEALKPETVFLQVPPDLPLFIKTGPKQDFRTRWFQFLNSGADARFFVNPKPQYTSDIILNNKNRIKSLYEHNLVPATDEYEIGKHCIYSRQKGLLQQDMKPDAILTPLLYSYQNLLNRNIQTCFGDMPMIIQRERFANSIKLPQAKQMLDQYLDEMEKGNFGYSPAIAHKDIFIKPRVAYMTEVLRQVAMVSQKDGAVAVFDSDLLPFIEAQWRALPKELQSLESLLKQPTPKARDPLKQETWLEFVEKQVILDQMFEPFIAQSFVQYNSFPYNPEDFLGKETALLNVFTFWKHYSEKYGTQANRTSVLEEEYNSWLQKDGQSFISEDSSDQGAKGVPESKDH